MFRFFVISFLALVGAPLWAITSITGLQNNYSFLLEGTPNHGIARGSIFIVYGTELAGPGLVLGTFEPTLDKNLGGVTIRVTVNGVTTEAIPYYISPGQLGAILPSATPAGQGTVIASYNGQTSAPYPILVVEGAFGLMTMGGNGLGQAVVMDANFNILTPANAPVEDQAIILWGSGLGPFAGDETQLIGSQRSLDELPFELYIGGKLAETFYHGRSQFPALDQIVAKIPAGVSGCFVSVYVKTGGYISNFTTIPVANPGAGACADYFATADEVRALASGETVSAGWLQVGTFVQHTQDMTGPTTSITDAATAQFLRYTSFDYTNWGGISQTSFGSCQLLTFPISAPFIPPILEGLDAGMVSLTLPGGGAQNLARQGFGYSATGSDSGAGIRRFVGQPGETHTYNVSGGAQVGAFSESVTLPPVFSVNGLANLTTIPRSQSLEITWTGGSPDSLVVVTGSSNDTTSAITQFTCSARASEGRLVVPRDILASMIPSVVFPGPFFITTGQILVYNYEPYRRFSAPGIDIGSIQSYIAETAIVEYQ